MAGHKTGHDRLTRPAHNEWRRLPGSRCGGFVQPGADIPRGAEGVWDAQAGAGQGLRGGDTVVVGDVVADEDRQAAGEGRAGHQRAYGGAFVGAAGTQFPGLVRWRHDEAVGVFEHGGHRVTQRGAVLGGSTVVQDEAVRLALEQRAWVSGGDAGAGGEPGVGRDRQDGALEWCAGSETECTTVLADDGGDGVGEEGCDLLDGAAADHGERAVEPGT